MRFTWLLALCALVTACAAPTATDDGGDQDTEDDPGTTAAALSSGGGAVSCKVTKMTGYEAGRSFSLDVITINGKRTTKTTGHAFLKMQKAAKAQGVTLSLTSGFRTQAEQQTLYNCYKNHSCNNGNLAAKPGYSNHQSGKAMDIGGGGSAGWLAKHGNTYGFRATVKGEPWHWEYSGKDPGGPCSNSSASSTEQDDGVAADSAPAQHSAAVPLASNTTPAPSVSGDDGSVCSTDDDCNPGTDPAGKICSTSGSCVAGCNKSSQCPGTELCIDGQCSDE